jgi:hypothetical protein
LPGELYYNPKGAFDHLAFRHLSLKCRSAIGKDCQSACCQAHFKSLDLPLGLGYDGIHRTEERNSNYD